MIEPVILDTDIISYFLRGNSEVRSRFGSYIQDGGSIRFTIITYYEIVSGLKDRGASQQLETFWAFSGQCEIEPLTEKSAQASAEV